MRGRAKGTRTREQGGVTAPSYRELEVWKKAMDLAVDVYRLTRRFPKSEALRLSSQMIRASSSIAANVAEGNSRATRKDYAHFVSIARGCAGKLETFLVLAERLEFVHPSETTALIARADEIPRRLNALRSRLIAS